MIYLNKVFLCIYYLLMQTNSHLGVFLSSLNQNLLLEKIIKIIVVVTADR